MKLLFLRGIAQSRKKYSGFNCVTTFGLTPYQQQLRNHFVAQIIYKYRLQDFHDIFYKLFGLGGQIVCSYNIIAGGVNTRRLCLLCFRIVLSVVLA